jgi:hypothetical protein
MFEWLYKSARLHVLGGCEFGDPKPWQFYDKLSKYNKKLAWSETGLSLAGFDPAYVMDKFHVEDPAVPPYLVIKMKTGSSIQLGRSMYHIPTLKDGTTFWTIRFPPNVLKQEIYHISVEETPHEEAPAGSDKQAKERRYYPAADGPAQPLPVFSERIMRQMAEKAGLKPGQFFGLDLQSTTTVIQGRRDQ